MKYFLMGAFATGFLVYGIALVYGTTGGELVYAGIAGHDGDGQQDAALLPGRVLHPHRAGVQGRGRALPHVGPRRLRGGADAGHRLHGRRREGRGLRRASCACSAPPSRARCMVFDFTGWASALSVLAALTMTLGNLAAIRQDNIKRMLAYSSIAHAGYLLIGVVAVGAGRRRRQAGRALLPGRLHLHDAGRVRRRRLDRQPQRRAPLRRRLGRASAPRARRWRWR